ncbi:hypothetical protein ACXR0O_13005 [Verrucomicrobiota bacterium sgz303538]
MIRPLLSHGIAFLAGLGATAVTLWFLLGGEKPASPSATSAAYAKKTSFVDFSHETPADASASDGGLPVSERLRRKVEATLAKLRGCGDTERAAHVDLLLKQLEREGRAGIEAMIALLARGEDYPLGPLFNGRHFRIAGAKTLRMAVLFELAKSKEPEAWLACRQAMTGMMRTTSSIEDAVDMARLMETREPGAHRAEAVAAMLRLSQNPNNGWKGDVVGNFPALQVMAHYGAVELLSKVEEEAFKRPEVHLYDYMGALWSLPAETREQATKRVLTSDAVRAAIDNYPPLMRLDYNIPEAREYAASCFSAERPATEKARWIEYLGEAKYWESSNALIYSRRETPPAAAGASVMLEQARARLTLLDQIAPSCPEPLLQQTIAEARAALQKQVAGGR